MANSFLSFKCKFYNDSCWDIVSKSDGILMIGKSIVNVDTYGRWDGPINANFYRHFCAVIPIL